MSSSAITFPSYLDPTKAADGSAAAPSFAFANSTSTGIYRVSANTLGISTAGVQRVVVTSAGDVGIGTASPSNTLHVRALQANLHLESTSPTNNALVRFTNNAGTAFCGIDNSAGGLGAAYGFHIYHPGNNPIVFSTNGSECMRISGNKNITMGNKSTAGEHAASGSGWSFAAPIDPYFTLVNANASGGNALIYANKRTAGAVMVFMTNNGTTDSVIGTISHNGSTITFSGSALSDARWKEDVTPIESALDAVKQVEFVEFVFTENNQKSAGVTAQQLKTIPSLAKFVNDGRDEDCYKAVDYQALTGYLGKAIQELSAKVDAQAAEAAALRSEIAELKAK
ncbi:MAG: tail fiber domain-containing protein [Cyanobacteria bacterium K_DeepCast_35m_m2_023]|nr:tail fiber domain-containing protein [Cyanobacteria bacterium K_DeepCast_35m_m2_023]